MRTETISLQMKQGSKPMKDSQQTKPIRKYILKEINIQKRLLITFKILKEIKDGGYNQGEGIMKNNQLKKFWKIKK